MMQLDLRESDADGSGGLPSEPTRRRAAVRASVIKHLDRARERCRPTFLVLWAEFAGHVKPLHRIRVREHGDLDALFAILWDVHPDSGGAGTRWALETERPASQWMLKRA